jgi:hypothetical protein
LNIRAKNEPAAVETRATADLVPYGRNARTHSDHQIDQIAASIREFGFTNPVLVDGENGIIAGHGRVLAARKLGLDAVPVIELSHLSAEQKRAYILADNQLALNAGWDLDILGDEWGALKSAGFDMDLLGFDDIDALLRGQIKAGKTDPDAVPDVPVVPVSALGDVWLLGAHRVMCGDAMTDDVERLLGGVKPDAAWCDPPYGVSAVKGGHISGGKPFGKGRVHGPSRNAIIPPGTYFPIIGDDGPETAIASAKVCADLSIPFVMLWGANNYANALPTSRCWVVWDKETTGNFSDVELAWTNRDAPARIFRHQWSGLMKASERGDRRVHPTQKPVALPEWCFTEFGKAGDVVLDLFLGSAPSLMAAERTERVLMGMELAPAYVDVSVRRWQDFTGQTAIHEASGETFADRKAALGIKAPEVA